MWELINTNKRRSAILVVAMLALMLILGFLVGSALIPSVTTTVIESQRSVPPNTPEPLIEPAVRFSPTGGVIGMIVAFAIWAVQALVAYFQGDRILLAVSGAREIEKADHPQLFNIVEEMTIASRLGKMPRIYIIDDMAPNAFATGRKPENAAVAVTAGLLGKLNRDQLQGVVAHEIAHIVHRDVLFMTMVGIMVGTVVMISEVFLRSLWYSGGGTRYRGNSKKGNQGQLLVLAVAVVFAILAPLLAQVIYFAVSRQREYLADAGAAVYTRYPEGLASALEAISSDTHVLRQANRATAPMYIINPLHKPGKMALKLTRTHPPIEERVRILRGLAGGVSYEKYQAAWSDVAGKNAAAMPAAALKEGARPIREGSGDDAPLGKAKANDARARVREAGDLMRKVNGFLFLPCACGMRIKLPPDFTKDHIGCPKCGTTLRVPVAELSALGGAGEILRAKGGAPSDIPLARAKRTKKEAAQAPLTVERRGRGWMSFKCPCGATRSISPAYAGDNLHCTGCGRAIHVKDV